jgi:hypothetical protein
MILLAHAAYRFWSGRIGSAAVFGFAMALAALTRGEGLILLGLPLALLWGLRPAGSPRSPRGPP